MANEINKYLKRLDHKIHNNKIRIEQMQYESRELKRRYDITPNDRLYNYRLIKLEAIRTLLNINSMLIVRYNRFAD